MTTFNYITTNGTIVPDVADIQAEVEAEFRQIFGDDFVTDPETPEGGLISAIVSERISVARNNAQLANQINPNLAGGRFLDAIWALTGGGRTLQTRSTVQITATGQANTRVPAGSRVESDNGVVWRSVSAFQLSATGTATATFEAEEFGPITASPNTITNIRDEVLGWETATNAVAAVPGQNTESDTAARSRRRQQLALQGRSIAEAMISLVSDVDGVRSLAFRENTANTTQVIDGITLVAHSVWMAVEGGSDQDVAAALLEGKSAGANWNGSTSVDVLEPASGQLFTVLFDRPTQVPISIRVTFRSELGTAPSNDILDAILNYAQGNLDGEEGFVTGSDVSPFEIGAAINSVVGGTFVRLVEVGRGTGQSVVYQSTTLDIALNEIATVTRSNITLVAQ